MYDSQSLTKMFFMFMSFEGINSKSCGVWDKKLSESLLARSFLAAKYAMRIALKPSKGFLMFLFIFNVTLLFFFLL